MRLRRQSEMARLPGLEPGTYGLEGRCSLQLSYRRSGGHDGHDYIGAGRLRSRRDSDAERRTRACGGGPIPLIPRARGGYKSGTLSSAKETLWPSWSLISCVNCSKPTWNCAAWSRRSRPTTGPPRCVAEQIARQKQEIEALRQKHKQARMAADKKELEVRQKRAEIEKLRDQQMQVKDNRQFSALQNEIKFAELAIGKFEDEILADMGDLEAVDADSQAGRRGPEAPGDGTRGHPQRDRGQEERHGRRDRRVPQTPRCARPDPAGKDRRPVQPHRRPPERRGPGGGRPRRGRGGRRLRLQRLPHERDAEHLRPAGRPDRDPLRLPQLHPHPVPGKVMTVPRTRPTGPRNAARRRRCVPEHLLLYVDGACSGNPGPCGSAAILKDPDGTTVLERARAFGPATNNVAEYQAVILGLELAAELKPRRLTIRSDSELMVRQLAGQYRVKAPHLETPLQPGPDGCSGRSTASRSSTFRARRTPRPTNSRRRPSRRPAPSTPPSPPRPASSRTPRPSA